jgi:hypothetical protein
LARPSNICLFYLPFTGGKFIANCLALSRHVALNRADLAIKDLQFATHNQDYYNFKLQSIIDSLPANFQETQQWIEFPGLDIPGGDQDLIQAIHTRKQTICHIAHWNSDCEKWKTKYLDLKILKIVNFKKFNSLCFMLKSPTKDLDRHSNGFESWAETAQNDDAELDMDAIMYNPDQFLIEMHRLYQYFELDDIQPTLLMRFYNTYRALHGLT